MNRTRPPGTFDASTRSVACGICSGTVEVPELDIDVFSPPGALHAAMKGVGWVDSHVWGWCHSGCVKTRRREIRAGHIQRSIFDQDGEQ